MPRLALCLISYLIVQDLVGSLAAHQDTGSSVCLLNDAPHQCSSFCMAALHPFFKCSDKLDRIGGVLKNTITREDFEAKLDQKLKTIKSEIQEELQLLLKKLEERLSSSDVKLEALLTEVEKNRAILPKRFKRIGTRYFYIEEDANITWPEAESTCKEKGGYLAAFQSESEITAVKAELKKNSTVWTGLRSPEDHRSVISVASGKTYFFQRWWPDPKISCSALDVDLDFIVKNCTEKAGLICQLENLV